MGSRGSRSSTTNSTSTGGCVPTRAALTKSNLERAIKAKEWWEEPDERELPDDRIAIWAAELRCHEAECKACAEEEHERIDEMLKKEWRWDILQGVVNWKDIKNHREIERNDRRRERELKRANWVIGVDVPEFDGDKTSMWHREAEN